MMDAVLTERLSDVLLVNPHNLVQPTSTQYKDFLQLAKYYLDPLAEDITQIQLERLKSARKSRKRKRRNNDDGRDGKPLLRMKTVHVDGFGIEQVWQQAKRVLNATAEEVEDALPREDQSSSDQDISKHVQDRTRGKAVRFVDDGLEIGESDEESEDDLEDDDEQDLISEEGMLNGNTDPGTDDEESLALDEETPLSDFDDDHESETGSKNVFVKDRHGLNDGFFSIDDFNKDTAFLEQQDARGDPNDGAASDEEDVDWGADPLSMPTPKQAVNASKLQRTKSQGQRNTERTDVPGESDDEEEDGPTFGNVDLNAPEGDSEDDDEVGEGDLLGMNDLGNTNNIRYSDFFAPPPKKPGKNRKNKPGRKPRPNASNNASARSKPGVQIESTDLAREPGDVEDEDEDEDEDVRRAMSTVQRDLFEDDDDDDDDISAEDDSQMNLKGSKAKQSNLSTHERQQAALRKEIQRLEAENVAAKPWTMMGEAIAPVRPMNSLLEEDLDFERAGKPVPVITEEVSESIEELIKRRILARDFNEVIRRQAGMEDINRQRGRNLPELSDTKPDKSLAEEYEQDHLRRTDANFVDARSEKLKATHKDIEAHWMSVSAQLDALSNFHFKPRPPTVSIEVRTDAPTISIEDARPGGNTSTVGATMLAPQEIFNLGNAKSSKDEVRTTGGTAIAREEMTREAKLRRRRREKERIKKRSGSDAAASSTAVKSANEKKKEVVKQLQKGGVKVIDRKSGDVRNLDGSMGNRNAPAMSVAMLKL